MRILIITHVFYPFQSPRSFRSTELAKELARRGHEVTVYANGGNCSYSDFENSFSVKVKSFRRLFFVRKTSCGSERYNFIEKLLLLLFRRILFYPNIEFLFNIKRSLRSESDYDLLISIASPHSIHWGCAWAILRNRSLTKQWIADCGDPFMGNIFERPPFYFKYLEKWFCRMADFLTVPIEGARNAYYHEFHRKIRVIPQGFKFDDVHTFQGKVSNKVITFAFAGMVYRNRRDPSELLSFLASQNLQFKFIVYTANPSLFLPYKDALGNRLEIRAYIDRKKLLHELSAMDFLVNIENVNSEQSPSKLIDYALTGRPILSVRSSEINKDQVLNFLRGDYSSSLQVELDSYRIENVAAKFLELH